MLNKKPTQLIMVKDDLSMLPCIALPDGFYTRSYHPGDEAAWEQIIAESFQKQIDFYQRMRSDIEFMPERIQFICTRENLPVATSSAWYKSRWNQHTGYMHMVGVLPKFSGRGLGYSVSLAALERMVVEGRTKAVLQTDDFRIPAIVTYLKLGFCPLFHAEDHVSRWSAICNKLGKRHVRCINMDGEESFIDRIPDNNRS
jgi:mycothiol synthase